MIDDKQHVLVVIHDENTRNTLSTAFIEPSCPFEYEIVASVQEALELLLQRKFQAIVMTKLVALSNDDGNIGLIKFQAELPPTVTILYLEDGFPNYLYNTLKPHD